MNRPIKFNLNGKPVTLNTDESRTLLWVLRTDLDLTGTKYGCGEGICGSCTVAVNGQAVRSCQTALAAIEGKNVVTVEGLEKDGKLHPLQEAFIDHGAFQCGYCTSGMLMTAYSFLQQHPKPSHADIVDGLNNNYCRCSAYNRIVTAVADASTKGGSR